MQLSPLQDWVACGSLISITERAAAYEEWARMRLPDFGERMRSRLMLGAFVSGVDYVQALRRRRELRAELKAAMADIDLVLTAVFPNEAPKIDAVPEMGYVRPGELHDAVQRCRLPGDVGVRWVRRRWPAGGDPARRQTVRGIHRAARR